MPLPKENKKGEKHPEDVKQRQQATNEVDMEGYGDKKLEGPNRPST
ncbi:hypothetical protein JOD45_001957 [Scopulibacillus daqui]|uniref:Uncharacterized protein n=1 Tax=Scopulibacillus daqui TaxID=1469162 RepID=A0ABS2Q0B6_9BACL|nr:hypothetical protein [Scopulibacillus daqui]MBM7645738.1 hypothetical protein [Scopulibacillus daqui]